MRVWVVIAGLLLLAAVVGGVAWLGLHAMLSLRKGRWLAATLAALAALGLLAAAVLVADVLGFALFWHS